MNAERHAGWAFRDRRVDQTRIAARQLVRVVATLPCTFAHLGVAEIGEVGIVKLQVGASRRGERVDLGAVGARNVGEKLLQVGIRFAADRVASTAEVQHGRRRYGDFRRTLGHRPQKIEVVHLNRLDVTHRRRDVHDRRREIDAAAGAVEADGDATLGLDAGKLLQKIDVEVGPPEFAVGNALEAETFLKADDVANGRVFHLAQLRPRNLALAVSLARIEQRSGAQEAADMVGAKGRFGASAHACASSKPIPRRGRQHAWRAAKPSGYDASNGKVWECARRIVRDGVVRRRHLETPAMMIRSPRPKERRCWAI